ncbi:MAG: 50S ribosomal protein L29 [Dinghuibacter sp.]|nr:50S ribosomal protein L29 [Dinghuibacter sp.]
MSKRDNFLSSIKELNEEALKARISEDEVRLRKLQFAHAVTPLENPMSIRSLRKDIARLKTELKKRQTAA